MRLVRIVLSLLLLAFGFVAAIFLMLLGLFASLLGGRPARPAFNVRFHRPGTTGATSAAPPIPPGDVIDVETTPVKE